jgi:hypothetical protein
VVHVHVNLWARFGIERTTISGNELPVKMHLEEISSYPAVSIPKFSTDHNAFFEHVAAYFLSLDMSFEVHYLVEDQSG